MDGTPRGGAGMGGGGLCWCGVRGALGGTGRGGAFLWKETKGSAGMRVVGEEDDGLGGNWGARLQPSPLVLAYKKYHVMYY